MTKIKKIKESDLQPKLKKKISDTKTESLHFKMRVIDLVEILVKRRADSSMMMAMIIPLLSAVKAAESAHSDALKMRLSSLLNKLCASKTYPKSPELDIAGAHTLFEELLLQAASVSKAAAPLASNCAIFTIRVLVGGSAPEDSSTKSIDGKKKLKAAPQVSDDSVLLNITPIVKTSSLLAVSYML